VGDGLGELLVREAEVLGNAGDAVPAQRLAEELEEPVFPQERGEEGADGDLLPVARAAGIERVDRPLRTSASARVRWNESEPRSSVLRTSDSAPERANVAASPSIGLPRSSAATSQSASALRLLRASPIPDRTCSSGERRT
jgi:hypothetical protein